MERLWMDYRWGIKGLWMPHKWGMNVPGMEQCPRCKWNKVFYSCAGKDVTDQMLHRNVHGWEESHSGHNLGGLSGANLARPTFVPSHIFQCVRISVMCDSMVTHATTDCMACILCSTGTWCSSHLHGPKIAEPTPLPVWPPFVQDSCRTLGCTEVGQRPSCRHYIDGSLDD